MSRGKIAVAASSSESVPLALLQEIDAICLRFEAEWKAGREPDIASLLHEVPEPARLELLTSLLSLDLEYRYRRGQAPEVESYARRFPEHRSTIEALAGDLSCLDFVLRPQRSTDRVVGAATASRADAISLSLAGARRIGKFEVVRPLKQGGQASALLAFDPDLKRHVVLKLYRDARTPEAQETVLREGQALARVHSPYVAQCFGVERYEGVPYLVVEYIPGLDLAEQQRSRPLAIVSALEIAGHLAEGLAAVHACGLLHRDIKPANVIIGDDGQPRLVDFGVAATLASDSLRGISGTSPYMAPEQARGLVERIDQRTDLFGLGALLYELLTGRPPYRGATDDEVLAAARVGEVTPPKELNRQVLEPLNELCMRCLARDPDNRFPSATALREAIRSCQRRQTWSKLLQPGKTWRRGVAAAVGGSLIAVLLFWVFGWPTGRQPFAAAPVADLAGELEIRVWNPPGSGEKRWVNVAEPGVLPVSNGELVHLEVQLNQPAFIYLLWIESQGVVKPLYPWNPATGFQGGMPAVSARTHLDSPAEIDRGWEVRSPSGLETAVLLVRRSPLPPDVRVSSLVGTLPPAHFTSPQEIVWLELTPGRGARQNKGVHRNLVTGASKQIDEPILNLLERLGPHFELIKIVRFAHLGD
jgi:tRNA A-37 threonylcarbamoyl transferase component Bud32